MRWQIVLVVAIGLDLSASTSPQVPYSRKSFYVPGYSSANLRSADGRFLASLVSYRNSRTGDDSASVSISNRATREVLGTAAIGLGLNTEMMWSPDSQSLAVTWSDAGGNGPYLVAVLRIENGSIKKVPLTPIVYKTFGHPYACGWPEHPNVGAIRWLNSQRILVAAEVVAHSVCDNFGTFVSYEIDLQTLKVVKTFNQLQSKKQFQGILGWELVNAPDECFTKPHSCEMEQNRDERIRMNAAVKH